MSDYRELLIGCGHSREKLADPLHTASRGQAAQGREWRNLETLDINPACKPDYLWDLRVTPWCRGPGEEHLPTSHYSEIHAYEVLEHLGKQGDAEAFFQTFWEIWRLLTPGGYLVATVPSRYSEWLWGDPGHCRVVLPCTLQFLDQTRYTLQLGLTRMSDYRHIYNGDFDVRYSHDDRITHQFILQAVKPSRIDTYGRTDTDSNR